MPCCVLRVDGKAFDPDAFLASSGLVADAVYRRGERRSARAIHETSGFTVLVSDADGNQFGQQVADAVSFLQKHTSDLARLVGYPGVEGVILDFGWDFPFKRVGGRFGRLPHELLVECASLHVEIEISVYGVDEA